MRPTRPKKGPAVPGANVRIASFRREDPDREDLKSLLFRMLTLSMKRRMTKIKYFYIDLENQ